MENEEINKILNGELYERIQAAKDGIALDKLINDKHPFVRAEVANKGYGLDKLIDDEEMWG